MRQAAEEFVETAIQKSHEFRSLMEHPAWESFMNLIDLQEENVKERAIYDDERSREYYRGMLDQLRALRSAIFEVIKTGEEEASKKPLAGIEDDVRTVDVFTPENVAQIKDRLKKIPVKDLATAMRSGTIRSHEGGEGSGFSGIS